MIYGKDVLKAKCVHCLSLQHLPETSHSKKNLTKHYRKCTMYSPEVLIILVISQSCIFSIQGDSGGICNTLGNDSMCDSKQKS